MPALRRCLFDKNRRLDFGATFYFNRSVPPAEDAVSSATAFGSAASGEHAAAAFTTTHWSVVLQAQGESPTAQEALEKLCRTELVIKRPFIWRAGWSIVAMRMFLPSGAEEPRSAGPPIFAFPATIPRTRARATSRNSISFSRSSSVQTTRLLRGCHCCRVNAVTLRNWSRQNPFSKRSACCALQKLAQRIRRCEWEIELVQKATSFRLRAPLETWPS
jgi:hypothetical protein